MTLPERVEHRITKLEGSIEGGRLLKAGAPDFAGDLAGRWISVLWDDGFRCEVPTDAIRFITEAPSNGRR